MNDISNTTPVKIFNIWLSATRPKTLWASFAPVLMGTAMAYSDGKLHWGAALVTLFGAMLIQVGTNFANDYYDFVKGADTTERLGPVRATQAGLVQPETMKKAFIFAFTLALFFGLYLVYRGGWPIVAIGFFSILCGILYTGGPYPLSYNGLGDIFALIFFGPVAVGGTYYVQALEINRLVLIAGLAPGLISTALLTVNNLRDIDTDRRAGKRTLAVRFGAAFARMEYFISLVIACVLPFTLSIINNNHRFAFITIAALVFATPGMKIVFSRQKGAVLNEALANTGRMLFFYSVVFSIGWIL